MFPSLNSAFTNGLTTHLGGFDNVKYINFITKEPRYELIKLKDDKELYIKTEEFFKINKEWKGVL